MSLDLLDHFIDNLEEAPILLFSFAGFYLGEIIHGCNLSYLGDIYLVMFRGSGAAWGAALPHTNGS